MADVPNFHSTVVSDGSGFIDGVGFTGPRFTASFGLTSGFPGYQVVASVDATANNAAGLPELFAPANVGGTVGATGGELVLQNAAGNVVIVGVSGAGAITGSHQVNVAGTATPAVLPAIHGEGFFGTQYTAGAPGVGSGAATQAGPELVAQFADGTIDLLGLDANGDFAFSFAIPGTAGYPQVVGVAALRDDMGAGFFGAAVGGFIPAGSDMGPNGFTGPTVDVAGGANENYLANPNIVMQFANGQIDLLTVHGNFNPNGGGPLGTTTAYNPATGAGGLEVHRTDALAGTVGLNPIRDVNPLDWDYFSADFNPSTALADQFSATVHLVGQIAATGQIVDYYLDSGYTFGTGAAGTLPGTGAFASAAGTGALTGVIGAEQVNQPTGLGANFVVTPGTDVFDFGTLAYNFA